MIVLYPKQKYNEYYYKGAAVLMFGYVSDETRYNNAKLCLVILTCIAEVGEHCSL